MLVRLSAPINVGEMFPLTLRFRNTGKVVLRVRAIIPGAAMGNTGAVKHKTH
jgi:copper(I)-binding protein